MNEVLVCTQETDQEYYVQSELIIGQEQPRSIKIFAGTVAGSPEKPNEDAHASTIQEGVLTVGIFDGCSNQKPIPALVPETGARFASHFMKDSFSSLTTDMSLKDGMINLNNRLLEKNITLGGSLDDVHTLAITTGTIVRINVDDNYLEFAHAGDCFCIVYFEDGTSQLLTNNLNRKFDDETSVLIQSIAEEKGITYREARKDERVARLLIDSFTRKLNNPDGSGCGCMNGDPHMELYLQTGQIPLDGVVAVLVGSDGLPPQGWDQNDEIGRQNMRMAIQAGGFSQLIQAKKESEDIDPDWHHIRFKHSDDATGIYIELSPSEASKPLV